MDESTIVFVLFYTNYFAQLYVGGPLASAIPPSN